MAYYDKNHVSYGDQQNLETSRGFSSRHQNVSDFKKGISQFGKSQQMLLICKVNSYLNAVSFQVIEEAYLPFEVLLESKFPILLKEIS